MTDTNVCVFTGRVGSDAELRHTNNSKSVLNWRMAVSTGWGDRQATMWLACKMWGQRAESLAQHMTKGTRVCVDGRMESREYEKDGVKRVVFELTATNVVLLGRSASNGARDAGRPPGQSRDTDGHNTGDPGPNDPGPPDDFGHGTGSVEDDIPF